MRFSRMGEFPRVAIWQGQNKANISAIGLETYGSTIRARAVHKFVSSVSGKGALDFSARAIRGNVSIGGVSAHSTAPYVSASSGQALTVVIYALTARKLVTVKVRKNVIL